MFNSIIFSTFFLSIIFLPHEPIFAIVDKTPIISTASEEKIVLAATKKKKRTLLDLFLFDIEDEDEEFVPAPRHEEPRTEEPFQSRPPHICGWSPCEPKSEPEPTQEQPFLPRVPM